MDKNIVWAFYIFLGNSVLEHSYSSKTIKGLEITFSKFSYWEIRACIFRIPFLFSCAILYKDSMTEIKLSMTELFGQQLWTLKCWLWWSGRASRWGIYNMVLRIPSCRTLWVCNGSLRRAFSSQTGNCFLCIPKNQPLFPWHLVCPEIFLLSFLTKVLEIIFNQWVLRNVTSA